MSSGAVGEEDSGSGGVRDGYKEVQLGPKTLEIPEEWEVKTLGEATEIVSGSTPKKSNPEYWGGNIVWITPTDITENGEKYISDSADRITDAGLENSSATLIEPDAVLMTSRATIGETSINTVPVTTNQGFKTLVPGERLETEYLYYFIPMLKDYLNEIGGGSTFSEISKTDVKSVRAPVPPLPEQRRIADILSTVDEEIQQTEEIIEELQEIRAGTIQDLYRRGYGSHSELVEASELATRDGGVNTSLDETTVGEIPADWDARRLDEITEETRYGVNESAEEFDPEKPRYIRITDIADDGHLKQDDLTSLSLEKAGDYLLEPGQLLFARTGATVGKTFLYSQEHPEAVYAGYLIKFEFDTDVVLPEFVFYFTQTDNYWRWVDRITRQGAQENINTGEYASILLPLPPIEEQRRIVETIQTVDERISEEREYKRELQQLKRGLMQDLLTGQVRVTPDE